MNKFNLVVTHEGTTANAVIEVIGREYLTSKGSSVSRFWIEPDLRAGMVNSLASAIPSAKCLEIDPASKRVKPAKLFKVKKKSKKTTKAKDE